MPISATSAPISPPGLVCAAFLLPIFGAGWTWLFILLAGGARQLAQRMRPRLRRSSSPSAHPPPFSPPWACSSPRNARRTPSHCAPCAPACSSFPSGAGLGLLAYLGVGDQHTDYMAHFFGFLAGLPFGAAGICLRLGPRTPPLAQSALACLAAALLATCWLLACQPSIIPHSAIRTPHSAFRISNHSPRRYHQDMVSLLSISDLRTAAQASRIAARVHGQIYSLLQKETQQRKPYWELILRRRRNPLRPPRMGRSPSFKQCAELSQGGFLEITGEFESSSSYGLDAKSWACRPLDPDEIEALLAGPRSLREKQARDYACIQDCVSSIAGPQAPGRLRHVPRGIGRALSAAPPAARNNHHARRGGLVEHTAR